MKYSGRPLLLLFLKAIGASIVAISAVSLLMILVGTLSFTLGRTLEELVAHDFKGITNVMIGGFFILLILLMTYVLSLTTINIILGVICGIIIAIYLYFAMKANKLNLNRSSIFGGLVIGLLGSTNFLIQSMLLGTSTQQSDFSLTFVPSVLTDWVFYWGILMVILMITLGFYAGARTGKLLTKGLLPKEIVA